MRSRQATGALMLFTVGILVGGCNSDSSELEVVAHAIKETAADGSQSLPSVVVYVRDRQGQPVTGLTEANFQITEVTTLPANPMTLVGFLNFSNTLMPGVYRMAPQFTPGPLKADGFIFAIGVKKSSDQLLPDAQALASLLN